MGFIPEVVRVADISSLVPHASEEVSPVEPNLAFKFGYALIKWKWWRSRQEAFSVTCTVPVLGADRLSSLHTLRRIGPGYSSYGVRSLPPTTVVDYLDLHEDRPRRTERWKDMWGVTLPPTLERYVLHVRLDDASTMLREEGERLDFLFFSAQEQMDAHRVRECRIVIHRPATTRAAILAQLAAVSRGANLWWSYWIEGTGKVTFKYVGFDEFELAASAATGTEDEMDRLEVAMRKVRADVAWRGSLSMDEWLEELRDRRDIEGEWVGRGQSLSAQ